MAEGALLREAEWTLDRRRVRSTDGSPLATVGTSESKKRSMKRNQQAALKRRQACASEFGTRYCFVEQAQRFQLLREEKDCAARAAR